jgi:hypothetical protein
MRDHDDIAALARYVLENPSEAGLAEQQSRYPFVGSDTTLVDIRRGVAAKSVL